MTELFTVHFTTKTPVRKYDGKGKVIAETVVATPVELPGLTEDQARTYKGNDNFRMVPYFGKPRASKGTGRDQGVGNGTKRVVRISGETAPVSTRTIADKGHGVSIVVTAARTGNMGAAING